MIDPSLTRTVRLYCDGELSPEEVQRFERTLGEHAELKQAVTFERALRERVASTMASAAPKAPESLAERVRQALAREIEPQPIPFPVDGAEHRPPRPAVRQPTWRLNYFAVAAVLAVVVGAVMFGLFFPPIDALTQGSPESASILSTLGTIAAEEHDRGASGAKELTLRDPVQMSSQLSKHLKSRVTPIDLSSLGYEFVGAATCGSLPCGGPSGQMLFSQKNDDGSIGGANISLFFVPEGHLADYLDYKLQRRWVKNNDIGPACGHRVLRLDYPDTGLVYFLVTCDPKMLEPASKVVLEQLHAACR